VVLKQIGNARRNRKWEAPDADGPGDANSTETFGLRLSHWIIFTKPEVRCGASQ